ncbi:unnamed protein product [Caenorhabditis auriculariae]|uniref:Uncharacterized protein n=1 Tax=Caenorhabditis auriculariae TaxID=2777116 RepID=A0A8S1HR86_9PELO|nr:unnamed protein product [Caenorhabditis auriculariae]
MPFVLIIYIYTTAYIFFSMTGDELYAANIALYKAPYEMTSFDVYLIPISLDYHVGEAGATLYLLSILMSAYVVPISFLIGNSQKRKMFLSLIRLDFMRNSKVHAESPATTN